MAVNNQFPVRQRGVALIQVLLISLMLLVLVVQISKDAQEQVVLARLMKERAVASLNLSSAIEKTKFALLTEDKFISTSNVLDTRWNFYGESFGLNSSTTLSLQDANGLISTAFSSKELVSYLGGQGVLIDSMTQWHGEGAVPDHHLDSVRGGLMPYLEELRFIAGWKSVDFSGLTHLPTKEFNVYNAPQNLLAKLYPPNQVAGFLALRNNGNNRIDDWKALNQELALVSSAPGSYIAVVATSKLDDTVITRKTRFMLNYYLPEPLVEVSM